MIAGHGPLAPLLDSSPKFKMLVSTMFRFAYKIQQIRAAEPRGSAGIRSSILIIFKSEPYTLDAYLGNKNVFLQGLSMRPYG